MISLAKGSCSLKPKLDLRYAIAKQLLESFLFLCLVLLLNLSRYVVNSFQLD